MNQQEILKLIEGHPHHKLKVAVTDIDGVLRGKFMHKDKFLSAVKSGFGFCDVVFGWDMNDALYEDMAIEATGWHSGFPDAEARLDVSTFRQVPWENHVPFVLGDFSKHDGEDFPACPRSLLKKIIAKAEGMGFQPLFSQEFEWFNFAENNSILEERGFTNPKPYTPGMFGYSLLRASENSDYFHDLFDLLTEFGVPLEGLHTETGPGVFEAAIQYSDILEAADRAVLFKTGVKEIAYKHGIMASFMAKQTADLPGCSGHVHQSLWDADKKRNLFFDSAHQDQISEVMRQYIAGQLFCLPYILPMLAPTVNSYKRLVEGAWAPTTLTWGVDNRTVALRALPLGEKSSRIETRVVGSDVNPYLAMAACLASGIYGIEKRLKLDTQQTVGNGYKDLQNGVLPSNLLEATDYMKSSDVANELFGEAFVDHFTKTRIWEWKEYSKHVSDWEIKRYFEII
ncbi:glutamine synthetase family protein [Reichenbachiella versicolor]|uniref:glutamine synthetase family protein n=1 Tax=Reichenbachiella versicolor TaxID=1821036 RepID=UPI000D6E6003|nr:glutamine synthetase family protein [Reichenbachiella versicolor]